MISLDHRISRWFFFEATQFKRDIEFVNLTFVEALTKKGEKNDTEIN